MTRVTHTDHETTFEGRALIVRITHGSGTRDDPTAVEILDPSPDGPEVYVAVAAATLKARLVPAAELDEALLLLEQGATRGTLLRVGGDDGPYQHKGGGRWDKVLP